MKKFIFTNKLLNIVKSKLNRWKFVKGFKLKFSWKTYVGEIGLAFVRLHNLSIDSIK